MNITEDYSQVVLIAHITAAAEELQAPSSGQKCTDLAKQPITKFISIFSLSLDAVTCNNSSDATIEVPSGDGAICKP